MASSDWLQYGKEVSDFVESQQGEDLQFHYVASTNCAAIAYDSKQQMIYVIFNNGREYVYLDTPYQTWYAFIYSSSQGNYVHRVLSQYSYFEL